MNKFISAILATAISISAVAMDNISGEELFIKLGLMKPRVGFELTRISDSENDRVCSSFDSKDLLIMTSSFYTNRLSFLEYAKTDIQSFKIYKELVTNNGGNIQDLFRIIGYHIDRRYMNCCGDDGIITGGPNNRGCIVQSMAFFQSIEAEQAGSNKSAKMGGYGINEQSSNTSAAMLQRLQTTCQANLGYSKPSKDLTFLGLDSALKMNMSCESFILDYTGLIADLYEYRYDIEGRRNIIGQGLNSYFILGSVEDAIEKDKILTEKELKYQKAVNRLIKNPFINKKGEPVSYPIEYSGFIGLKVFLTTILFSPSFQTEIMKNGYTINKDLLAISKYIIEKNTPKLKEILDKTVIKMEAEEAKETEIKALMLKKQKEEYQQKNTDNYIKNRKDRFK